MPSEKGKNPLVALAAAAHPDDIEFLMAGTLLLLKKAGASIHLWNLSNGYCGSDTLNSETIVKIRWEDAQASARVAGAVMHPPIGEDIAIMHEPELIRKAAAVIRTIKPSIMLVPSPQDYMEDHQNTCRVLVTAAFVKMISNYITSPPVEHYSGATAVYHAMPHGLRDSLRKRIKPGQYVDITSVLTQKRTMLSMHKSQKEWLDFQQGIDSYLLTMEAMAREIGSMSGKFEYAEGWRRHNHLGFCPEGYDPLSDLLGTACWTDPEYEHSLL